MSILSGLLGPAISTATNAVGTYENAQANAAKSNMAAVLERAQIDREAKQDQLRAAIAQRQADRDAGLDIFRQKQFGLSALRQGFVPVAPGDPGQTSPLSAVPMPGGRRYDIAPGYSVEHSDALDPYNRKESATLDEIAARGTQSRLTRQTVPGGVAYRGGQSHGQTREQYILKRITALTKPAKGFGGLTQPGLSVDAATQRAGDEYDKSSGASSPPSPATPSFPRAGANDNPGIDLNRMTPGELAAHQKIDSDLQEAIKQGANPQKAMERANQLHAKVGGL